MEGEVGFMRADIVDIIQVRHKVAGVAERRRMDKWLCCQMGVYECYRASDTLKGKPDEKVFRAIAAV